MANKHTTLASLFDDIADAIRELLGTSPNIVADNFPDKLREIMPCKINDKYGIAIPNVSTATINQVFTPKCFYHIGSYWFIGGENSSHDGYVAFSTDRVNWTIRLIGPGATRKFPVNALAYYPSSDTLYVFGDSNSYKSRYIIYFSNFISNYAPGIYNYMSSSDVSNITSAVQSDHYVWAVRGDNKTWFIDLSNNEGDIYSHSPISRGYRKTCMYKSYPIAISNDGYYTYKISISGSSVVGEFQIASGFNSAVCAQMGDYFVAAGTKSDGTYLYYSNGTPGSLGGMAFTASKILSTQVTPIGLAYANGLYVMAYMENNVLRFYATESLGNSHGITNLVATAIKNNTGVALVANGNDMAVLTEGGGNPIVGYYTVANE